MCDNCEARYSQHCPCDDTPTEDWKCDICGDPIVEGDEYAPVGGNRCHKDCLRELDIAELLELCGIPVLVAFDCPEDPCPYHDPEVEGI